ncbi:hypothetical protein L2E82_34622 [Cichorium intybus]|uniref:Uncharacterized protein n=1 Tax=Cichorium intybus TaxID=13427 RepID=A0ACB9BMF2_CICIN|nr:hypothetical protein L2E82_34622 [Cichorium intybus]
MKPSRFLLLLFVCMVMLESRADLPGTWELLVEDARIASMHTAVTRFNTVILLDRTNVGPTQTTLDPSSKSDCQIDPEHPVLKPGCYSQSAILDLNTKKVRPLFTTLTDTWCSSGQFMPDGTLLQTGGNNDGYKKIRKLIPCEATSSCDWDELEDTELAEGRWYSTNQILPNGSVIIIGGRDAVSVELFPSQGGGALNFPFLAEAEDIQTDNLYPYVHLLPNGHLFVFANNQSVLYDYTNNVVLKRYPVLTGGPRNYPSAGSSVMLALKGDYSTATVVVCGGAQYGAFHEGKTDATARRSCGRIEATAENPVWEMEAMPFGRIMGDMVILPTGDVLIINGAEAGSQGFEMASRPCLSPVLYKPDESMGLRFVTLNNTSVPRMYHSTANLLPDGRVLVAGSNPHNFYNLTDKFPTELSIEAFSPDYMSPEKASIRPTITELPEKIQYGGGFDIVVSGKFLEVGLVEVNIASAPFATHSFSQGQRLVKLAVSRSSSAADMDGGRLHTLTCTAPPDGRVAPPGYYMLFAVNMGVPSVAKWVQLLER